ncbi:DUF3243 domain-containing protein [Bacillus sp. FSL W7-1360]
MSVLDSWDHWKQFLGGRLEQAQQEGMSEEVITDVAEQVGAYLAEQVEPKNEQERVLAELCRVADAEERHAIAHMMVKLVDQ